MYMNKWTKDTVIKEAKRYKYYQEFRKFGKGALAAAQRLGLMDEINILLIRQLRTWTNEELKEAASKYISRKEFQVNNRAAYKFAFNHGLLDKVCVHMPKNKLIGAISHNRKWWPENIQEEALKYDSRHKFKKGNEGAYDAAKDLKILDKVCKHMKKAINSSHSELKLFNEIKKLYPNIVKLIDRKVKILSKPYIKGLHIDIFDPITQKGIEFDGEYWHSLEGLKRTRSHWPENDLLDYHQIKDDYFLSKGIQILHIKEKDWLEDPEQSLSKALYFLSTKD